MKVSTSFVPMSASIVADFKIRRKYLHSLAEFIKILNFKISEDLKLKGFLFKYFQFWPVAKLIKVVTYKKFIFFVV